MNRLKRIVFLLSFTLLLSSCVKHYTVPTEKEPHAILKVKVNFDRQKQIGSLPATPYTSSLQANLMLTEIAKDGKISDPMQVATVADEMSGDRTSSPIETFSTRLQPGKQVNLLLWDGIVWTTRTREMVRKSRQVPEQVSKNVSRYNSYTQKYESSYETVTEYRTEYYEELDWKVRNFSLGCQAKAGLTPQQGKIYLLDYSNYDLAKTCTAQIFLQEAKEGGGFKLTPVKQEKLNKKTK